MAETRDIIDFSQGQKPVEVMRSFNDIMAQKVHDAIQNKRIEVASTMFNSDAESDTIERLKAAATQSNEVEAPEDSADLDDELLNLTDEEWEALDTDEWDVESDKNSEQNNEE